MDDFGKMAQDWAGFFSALAQVAGGLVGLVFVGLTFNAKALGSGGDPMLSALARQTFGDFLLLLLISLVMLAPHLGAQSTGAILLGSAAFECVRILVRLLGLRRHLRRPEGGWFVVHRFALSAVARLLIGAAGLSVLRESAGADLTGSLLLAGVLLLTLSGCRSAWLLVMQESG